MSVITILSKIFDWIPGKRERYRAKIRAIKRELAILTQQKSTPARRTRYSVLTKQLQQYEERIQDT